MDKGTIKTIIAEQAEEIEERRKKERRRDLQNQALVTVCSQIAEALCLRTRPIKVVYYDRPSASFRVQLRP